MPKLKSFIPTLILILFCGAGLHAQQTVSPAGGNAAGTGGSMSYTVGQVDFVMGASISGSMAEGVQHPFSNATTTAPINGPSHLCAGSTATLTDSTVGGIWSSSNTSVATIGSSSGLLTSISGGVVVISYAVPGSGSMAVFTNIIVDTLPNTGVIAGASSLCAGTSITLSDVPTGGVWSSSVPGVVTIGSGSGIIAGISAGTSVIMYIATNACGADTATKAITVNPLPGAGSISGSPTVCAGANITLTDAAVGGVWSSGAHGIATIGSTGIVTGVSAGTAIISYTVNNSCGSAYTTMPVTVNPLIPYAGIVTGPNSVVTGSAITLADAVAGGVWSASNANATVSATGIVTGVTAGTVTISYAITNTCGTGVATKIVTVNIPLGPIMGTLAVCQGATTTLSNTVTGGSWLSSNHSIASVSGAGVVTGNASGTAVITYVLSSNYVTATVSVYPMPAAITGTGSVCAGSTTNLTDATTGGTWGSSNASVATVGSTGVVTGIAAGTATISYISGCGTTTIITVNPLPVAGTITGTATVCVGAITNLTDAVSGGIWSSGSPGIATVGTNGRVTGIASGTAKVSYAITNSCGSVSATIVVTVNSATAGTITGPSSVNAGANITLTDAVSGGVWSASNPNATVSGGFVTGVTIGTVTISYSVTGSCGTAVVTKVITITSPLLPGINGIARVCTGAISSLSDPTSGGTWSSSNVAVATIGGTTGIVTGVVAGTTNITYRIGSSYATIIVTVNPSPLPIQGSTSECVGVMVTLSDASAGGAWSSSNANVNVGPGNITGITVGSSTITYMLPDGCYTTYPNTVLPNPVAITGVGFMCVGGTTMLTDSTSGSLSWTSSNTLVATVINSGQVTGVAAGTATITYKVTSGCIATTIVTINALPAAISGNGHLCAGSAITLSDAAGSGLWSSSNTAIATVGSGSGVVTGVVGGTATVTYTAATGCKTTTIVTVSPILPISGNTNVCTGTTTALTDATTGGTWLSGNTGIATVGSATGIVTGVSAGSVSITYTLASGCSRATIVNVGTMTPILGTTALCTNTTTTLSDATTGGTWNMSCALIASVGSASGIVTASNAYTGTATISYSIGSCVVTRILTVNANPTPVQGATLSCAGTTITLSDLTAGGTWSSTGDASIGSTGILTAGVSSGTATITYMLNTGCYVTYPNTIYPNPSAIVGTFTVCAGATTMLTDTTSGSLSWTSSNTLVATAINSGQITGVTAGTATITYKILAGTTCITTQVVTVNAAPVVTAISGPASISHSTPATLSDATAGGVWSSSNTSVIALSGSTGSPITATAVVTAGTSIINYVVTNGLGCKTTVTKTITTSPAPPPHSTGIASTSSSKGGEVLLYPNPTNGTINIKTDIAGIFYLYSMDGKALCEYKISDGVTNMILPNELATGVYMGKYAGDDGSTVQFKIMKQ